MNIIIGILFIISGLAFIYNFKYGESKMEGLKFRTIVTGVLLVCCGIYLLRH